MSTLLYVVSPATREIIPYQYPFRSTFKPIIDDLSRKGKPSKLILISIGLTSLLRPNLQIGEVVHKSRDSELILALPDKISPDNLPFDNPSQQNSLALFLKWDLSELYPLYISPTDTVGNVMNYFKNKYNIKASLVKIGNISIRDLIDSEEPLMKTITEDNTHFFILREDRSTTLKTLFERQRLASELVLGVFEQLPIATIVSACYFSSFFEPFCNLESIWEQLLERYFGLTNEQIIIENRDLEEISSSKDLFMMLERDSRLLPIKTSQEFKISDIDLPKYTLNEPPSEDLETNLKEMAKYLDFALTRKMDSDDFRRTMSSLDNPYDHTPVDISVTYNRFMERSLGETDEEIIYLSLPRVHHFEINTFWENVEIQVKNNKLTVSDIVLAIISYTAKIPLIAGRDPWGDSAQFESFYRNINEPEILSFVVNLGS